jgi:RNA polymerase sigma-70 factor (ECF subfamily)
MDCPNDLNAGIGPLNPDFALIHALQRGESPAFEQLYDRYATYVYNTCLAMLGRAEDARDATQETFVQVFRSIKRFRAESSLSSWIYRIAVRKCVDLLRGNRRHATVELSELAEELTTFAPDAEVEAQLRATLLALKPDYRIVLILFHHLRLSYQEIAEVLHCSPDQIRIRLHRARHAFRERYAQEGGA